jgi:IclR family transcriptional regulator, KDG regulon repressor
MMEKESFGAIFKVLNLLEVFLKDSENEIGISRMAELTGLKVSTVHRIASTLVEKGYLSQQGKRGKYTLGLKFLEFSNALKRNMKIRDIALPYLEKLRVVSGESTNLAISDQNSVVYIEHVDSNQTLRTFTKVGNRAPLYCTGVGKVFLAFMNADDKGFLNDFNFTRYTDNTLMSCEELEKEIAVIKREGVAIDNGEMEIGVRCIAAPVRDSNGQVAAAVSISGPYTRLNGTRVEELKPMVLSFALDISRAIGYTGS